MPRSLRIGLIAVAVAGLASGASSQDGGEAIYRAANNLSHEYAQCAAYFLVVSVAMENSDKPDVAKQYEEVSNRAFEAAAGYAETIGLLPETTQSRFEMEFVQMADRIAGNTSNISILGREFAQPCQVAMEDMASRVDYWFAKEGVVR